MTITLIKALFIVVETELVLPHTPATQVNLIQFENIVQFYRIY